MATVKLDMTGEGRRPKSVEDIEARTAAGVFSRDMLDWKDSLGDRPIWAEPGRGPTPSREHVPGQAPVFRTDFSDDAEWEAMMEEVDRASEDGGGASVNFVNDPSLRDAEPRSLAQEGYYFVFDREACLGEGHPVLVISTDPQDDPSSFRASADSIPLLDANISIGNVHVEDFAEQVGDDGVFR